MGDMATAGLLYVTVEHATDLRLHHRRRRHDLSCVVYLGSQSAATQPAVNGGSHPVWNQSFQFILAEDEDWLEVEVQDSCSSRSVRVNGHAGCTTVPLHGVRAARSEHVQVPLFIQRRSTRLQRGFIALALAFWPPGTFTIQPSPVTAVPAGVTPGNPFAAGPIPAQAPGPMATDGIPAAAEVDGKPETMGPSRPFAAVCMGIPVAALPATGSYPFAVAAPQVPSYMPPYAYRMQQNSCSRDGAQDEPCVRRGMGDDASRAAAEAGSPMQPSPQRPPPKE